MKIKYTMQTVVMVAVIFVTIYCNNTSLAFNGGGPYTTKQGTPVTLTADISNPASLPEDEYDFLYAGWDLDNDTNIDISGQMITLAFPEIGVFSLHFIGYYKNISDPQSSTVYISAPAIITVTPGSLVEAGGPYIVYKASKSNITGSYSDNNYIEIIQTCWDVDNDNQIDWIGDSFSQYCMQTGTHTFTYMAEISTPYFGTGWVRDTAQVVVFNPAPIINSDFTIERSEHLNISISGSYSDQFIYDSHTMKARWDDGSVPTNIPVYGNKFQIDHTYDLPGRYEVSIEIYDADNGSNKESVAVFINSMVHAQTLFENHISIPDYQRSKSYEVNIIWGDLTYTSYTTTNSFANIQHQYNETGEYNIFVVIKAAGRQDQSYNFRIKVLPKPPVSIALQSVVLKWDAIPGKQYLLYFSDDMGAHYYLMDNDSSGYFIDEGDIDGFDNIAGNSDDRSHPLNALQRLYKIDW